MKNPVNLFKNPQIRSYAEWLIHYRLAFLILFQILLLAMAYVGSYLLRFEDLIPQKYYTIMIRTLPLFVVVQGGVFYFLGLYRGLWRYVGFTDLRNIIRAALLSMVIVITVQIFIRPYTGVIPISIYILDTILVIILVGGARLIVRHFRESYLPAGESIRVMVIGKVDQAEALIRDMSSHPGPYLPVVLVSPSTKFRGFRLYDVPIMGGLQQIPRAIKRFGVHEILFAWPDAPPDQLNEIIKDCKRWQVRYKRVPSLGDMLDGRFRLADVRDIELEDLLPRPPVFIEEEEVKQFIQDQVILVTGGGGSIGSELCRQVAQFKPRALIIIERAENSLYEIEVGLRRRFPDLDLQALVASINDGPGLHILLKKYRPDLIFHAAAYKHVPLMERCPIEAAYNNILGTQHLVKAALAAETARFIMISTDKAVNPTSVMGVSKRIAEKYVQACNSQQKTRFITTRFGNVLGSAGSVIPILKEQLARGGPLTVTHPEIERFFMTIPESVQLVLQAAHMGQGGDIFILNMGSAVKIVDLAEKLIVLAGKTPGKDVAISYMGLRPGEKLYEELFNVDEESSLTAHPLINRAIRAPESLEILNAHLNEITILVHKRDVEGLIAKFKELVPNYTPDYEKPERFEKGFQEKPDLKSVLEAT
jgi:FlaA1/EpsC-like NDP-sugar epimerase